jgi:dipeptidase D
MNHVTQKLKPQRVWYHFEEIAKIPHASGNEEKVAEYIIEFSKINNLTCAKDQAGNVLVVKPSAKGFESKPVIVLQSHLDMVPEKNEGSDHDFSKDPIALVIEGGWMKAKDTTLGADNGIGVAVMLAILEDKSLRAGKIECLFTVGEETGLNGALALDPELLEGRLLVNLDTEEISTIYIGCAGGRDSLLELPLKTKQAALGYKGIKVGARGLLGGHSGLDIHKGRGNAVKLIARMLKQLEKKLRYNIVSFEGGDKLNAIPREAFCTIAVKEDSLGPAKKLLSKLFSDIKNEYAESDGNLSFSAEECPLPNELYDETSTRIITDLLMMLPHGVISMSPVIEGLVETSSNLASVKTEDETLRVGTSQRSSVGSALEWMSDAHLSIARVCGAQIEQPPGYPGWNPDPASKLLKKAKAAFEYVTGEKAETKAIHAGLECGIIKEKYEGMDVISIGPTVEGGHSPYERVDIESVETFWEILLATFEEIYRG